MTTRKRDREVLKAIEILKNSEYKVTGLKVELEAQLNREWDEDECEDWIWSKLTDKDKQCIVFKQFYNDHSVDSELTFTISLKDPQAVFILPKIVKIFTELADEMNCEIDVRGAGMHMALLQTKDAHYPSRPKVENSVRFQNFRKSMTMLLPALFFLGTANEKTRALRYRLPMISGNSKYCAIAYRGGALEYRVFDTCYDAPDHILDNVIVMANTIGFWSAIYKPVKVPVHHARFGTERGYTDLKYLYVTNDHLKLLNTGLDLLAPKYKTVSESKLQRKFDIDEKQIDEQEKERLKTVELDYREYEERYEFLQRYYATRQGITVEQLPSNAVRKRLYLQQKEPLLEETNTTSSLGG